MATKKSGGAFHSAKTGKFVSTKYGNAKPNKVEYVKNKK